MEPIYFARPEELRTWLEQHHADAGELLVGYHRKGTGVPSLTWPQSVDEALCFGWIDGIRRGVDAERYTIRFTPRKARSIWSAVNIARAQELIAEGRMQPAGLAAFEARSEQRSKVYSYEQDRSAALTEEEERRFRAHPAAWADFEARPAGYRRTVLHWVTSAKRPETRARRLDQLIEDSAHGRKIRQLQRPGERDG